MAKTDAVMPASDGPIRSSSVGFINFHCMRLCLAISNAQAIELCPTGSLPHHLILDCGSVVTLENRSTWYNKAPESSYH